jgi:hypothetical protein
MDDHFVVSPVCNRCSHLISQSQRRCAAFGESGSIPNEIWQGLNPHTTPVPGDGGITFQESTESLRFSVEPEQ